MISKYVNRADSQSGYLMSTAFRILTVLLMSLLPFSVGCSKKPRVPSPTVQPDSPSESTSGSMGSAFAPTLDLLIEPETIKAGDSALLTWETEHATHVVIEPAIGPVEPSGRIKFFPETTMTYSVTAEGAGGKLSKSVTVTVAADQTLTSPGVLEEDLADSSIADRFNFHVKPVFFEFDSAELTEEARLTLEGNIHWLRQVENRLVRFVLEGHTDERGSEEYNLALGDRRAQVVKDYLINGGIEASRIEAISLGEEQPIDRGTTEEAYALNRRTHFVLLN